MRLRISVRGRVPPSDPCYFQTTKLAIFEGKNLSNYITIDGTMSDDEVVVVVVSRPNRTDHEKESGEKRSLLPPSLGSLPKKATSPQKRWRCLMYSRGTCFVHVYPLPRLLLSADPELALALRVSMEEQRQRQEEEAKRTQQAAAPKEITIPEDNEEGE